MDPTVRRATRADAESVVRIARESWHGAYDGILGAETVDDVVDEWYEVGRLADSIAAAERDDATFRVAEAPGDDAELVGFAHAGPDSEAADVAYLIRTYVRPDAWGEGAGTALLDRVEADLAASFDRLRLTVLADNAVGVSFYESRGFDRIEAHDSDLGEGLAEYVYETEL